MQAPARRSDWRSLSVPDQLPGGRAAPVRASAHVLSLELAARTAPELAPVSGTVARGRRAVVLAVCCLSLFMVGLDNTSVNVGLPSIGRDLHAGVSGLQWTIAAYTIVLAALLMLAGALADLIRRPAVLQG